VERLVRIDTSRELGCRVLPAFGLFGRRPVSPVNPVGVPEGDPSALEAVRDGHAVHLERLEDI
jgi:hypothetical protein